MKTGGAEINENKKFSPLSVPSLVELEQAVKSVVSSRLIFKVF